MINILIVDDHEVVRRGLQAMLVDISGFKVLAEAESGQEALDMVDTLDLNVVILDIGMAGRDGLGVLQELKHRYPSLGIIVFSMHAEEQYAIRCFGYGANAYISKQNPPADLISAIREVARGRNYVTPSIAARMATLIQDGSPIKLHEKLSTREFRILIKIGAGMSLAKIADELFLSPKTVSTYKTRILKKMGMKNSASLIQYVQKEGL